MKELVKAAAVALGVAGAASAGQAQTLNMMKSLDAPHYDGHRTTWSPASDIINMIQDTLVALDWDGKTVLPYLAKSWEVSPDGKTYTFKLRDDILFCSGKKLTSEDVIYSFKRLKSVETRAPYAWRAGDIKELRATDPLTVVYELNEPYSDLLLQLTMYTNAIHNKDSVEKLGKDYGINGIDGTGPWCFVSWQPRTEILLKRHDAYRWGPSMYDNKGPVKFEKLSIKIVPEELKPPGSDDGRPVRHHPSDAPAVPAAGAGRPELVGAGGDTQLPASVLRLQDHAPDGVGSARARSHEHCHQPCRHDQRRHARQCRGGGNIRAS